MSKPKLKIVIFVLIIPILIFVGIILFGEWKIYQDEKRKEEMPAGDLLEFNLGVLPKNFILKETTEYKTLKNEDIGISFWVANDWKVVGYLDDYIDLKDPNYESDPETFDRISGCKIIVEVKYFTLPGTLHYRVNGIRTGSIQPNENENILEIDGHDALRIVESDGWLSKSGVEKTIEIRIPLSKADIYFSTAVFREDSTECEERLDNLLETVSIQ